jgi:hypothetical protein
MKSYRPAQLLFRVQVVEGLSAQYGNVAEGRLISENSLASQ